MMKRTHPPHIPAVLALCFFCVSTWSAQAPGTTDPRILVDVSGKTKPVKTLSDWARRREQIQKGMQAVMGPLPLPDRMVAPDVQVLDEQEFPAYVQKKITFAVESWDRLPALLLIPKSLQGKAPAMLCLHPTSELGKAVVCGRGTGSNRNYGQELAERGYVVLAPDYPGFGDYVDARKALYEHGYKSATMKGIWNHMRCVDLLAGLPEVDPDRIGCMGHSLGGHNTLFLGVFDTRLKVLATSCGFTAFAKYYAGDLTGWTHPGYMPAIASECGKDPARMPFDFPAVLSALAPRPLFINAPLRDENFEVSGVRDCVDIAQSVYALYGAKDLITAVYPDAEHDFPDESRVQAYALVDKVLRAPRATPTPEQLAWHDMDVEMFLCLAPNTWQNIEYDDHSTPVGQINPDKLDTDQWARVAVSMGAKQIVFVAKHTGGFCWWQTDTTDYGVKETPWRGGKGDVMRDLAESCRKAGLKLGVYLSPQDDRYGAAGGGKCKDAPAQQVYDRVYRQQLTELLSQYGDIAEMWYDGGLVIEVGDILKQYAARTIIFQGKYASIRWVGNEDGVAPYPAWNAVSREAWQRGATAADGNPYGEIWLPNEVDTVNVFPHYWFWNNKPGRRLRSQEQLMTCYYRSVGHGAVLLLNQTPDTTGLIPEADARQAAEFGAEVKRRFDKPLAETSGKGGTVTLDLEKPAKIDHVVIMEDLAGGERILEYVIEGKVGKEWKELVRGAAVGHKKIDQIEPVKVSTVRLRCVQAAAPPVIRTLAVYSMR